MEYGIILAEAAGPSASIAWQVILTVGVIIAIGANLMTIVKKPTTAITPDPLRVEKLDKFATRDFCEKIHTEADRRIGRVEQDIRDIYTELKSTRENVRVELSQKIDDTRVELSDKIDGMESRIIATLKNTGAI